MTTFLDLPEEIYQLIAELLGPKAIYSCIRVCRSFYSSFIPFLWNDLVVTPYQGEAIDVAAVRANAHRVDSVYYGSRLIEEYYTITFPRLRAMRLDSYYRDETRPNYLQVQPHQKARFARLHPSVRMLKYYHKDKPPREFWEVVETEWSDFECLEFSGFIEKDAVDVFWRVCDRTQDLHLIGVDIPDSLSTLSTLSFRRLRNLTVKKLPYHTGIPHRLWPLQLLERVKESTELRRLDWDVVKIGFPVQLFLEALGEGCWPELCEFTMGDPSCIDRDLANILRALTSGRLTDLRLSNRRLGPLTFNCLRERYFGHLRELHLGSCFGVRSEMAQEILTECVNLVTLDTPHIFVRDIATASRPWGCLGLQKLVVYIVKQLDDEDGWDSRVFEQISRLRRLQSLDLQHDPHFSIFDDEPRDRRIFDSKTLDLRLPHSISRDSNHSIGNGVDGGGNDGGLSCWASLVQLQDFSFDGDRQLLGMAEARWMVEHWRNLSSIEGDFKGVDSDDDREQLQLLFRQKNISFFK